jgi:hypothetical protein
MGTSGADPSKDETRFGHSVSGPVDNGVLGTKTGY